MKCAKCGIPLSGFNAWDASLSAGGYRIGEDSTKPGQQAKPEDLRCARCYVGYDPIVGGKPWWKDLKCLI